MATRKSSVVKQENPAAVVRRLGARTKTPVSPLTSQQAEYRELIAKIDQRLDELSARADRFTAKG